MLLSVCLWALPFYTKAIMLQRRWDVIRSKCGLRSAHAGLNEMKQLRKANLSKPALFFGGCGGVFFRTQMIGKTFRSAGKPASPVMRRVHELTGICEK